MEKQEQIDALKAQVNCLREALIKIKQEPNETLSDGKALKEIIRITTAAMQATPEQCLAEVNVKVVSDMQLKLTPYTIDGNAYYRAGDIYMYTNQLREQAK